MACLKGFEPPTNGLEGRCSILLSYRHRQCVVWSGWWESDPRSQLGRLVFYHWTTPALQQPLHYISVAKNCQRFEIFFCDFFREVSYFGQQVTNFATTFVVIRLQEVNTFKKLVSRLAGKVQLCRAQKFARTALLKRRWKTPQLAPQFWNTFVVIRLLKASTFKNLWTLLSEKCNVAGHKNLHALFFWNAVEKHGNLHHKFEKKLHLLFADFTNLIR